jgi:hypothetical protein
MKDIKPFLIHEHSQIANNIARLEQGLRDHNNEHANTESGQRALLDIQCARLDLINELLRYVDDPLGVHALCLVRLQAVIERHKRLAQREHNHTGRHSDAWWQTLDRVEYLTYLVEHIQHLTLVR